MPVAVATRGLKRICPSCGTRYYDFDKRPIFCPDCKTEFTGEIKMKSRRSRATIVEDDEAVLGNEGIEEGEILENEEAEEIESDEDTVSLDDVEEGEDDSDDDLDVEDFDDDLDEDFDDEDDDDDDDDEDEEDED